MAEDPANGSLLPLARPRPRNRRDRIGRWLAQFTGPQRYSTDRQLNIVQGTRPLSGTAYPPIPPPGLQSTYLFRDYDEPQQAADVDAAWLTTFSETVKKFGPDKRSGGTCSIYPVPPDIRARDVGAYEPVVVCIGPRFNSWIDSNLRPMQDYKWRCVHKLLARRCPLDQPDSTQILQKTCLLAMKALESRVRSSYSQEIRPGNELAETMMLDGCFILQLLLRGQGGKSKDFEELQDSQILGRLWIWNLVKYDLLLLENQIPFFIIEKLFDLLRTPADADVHLVDRALRLFGNLRPCRMEAASSFIPSHRVQHLLHLVYLSLLPSQEWTNASGYWPPPSSTVIAQTPEVFVDLPLLPKPSSQWPPPVEVSEERPPPPDSYIELLPPLPISAEWLPPLDPSNDWPAPVELSIVQPPPPPGPPAGWPQPLPSEPSNDWPPPLELSTEQPPPPGPPAGWPQPLPSVPSNVWLPPLEVYAEQPAPPAPPLPPPEPPITEAYTNQLLPPEPFINQPLLQETSTGQPSPPIPSIDQPLLQEPSADQQPPPTQPDSFTELPQVAYPFTQWPPQSKPFTDYSLPPGPSTDLLSPPPEWIPSATELQEAGIKFKKNKTARSFLDIKFRKGIMEIPPLDIYDYSIPLFRNLIAFEQCYPYTNCMITIYAAFMDCLINTSNDMRLLHLNGIVINRMSTDQEVTHFFSRLCKNIHYDSERNYLGGVLKDVSGYHDSKFHKWRAGLVRDYFSNPWAIISMGAALLLLVLTIIQTFFAAYSYFRPPN